MNAPQLVATAHECEEFEVDHIPVLRSDGSERLIRIKVCIDPDCGEYFEDDEEF